MKKIFDGPSIGWPVSDYEEGRIVIRPDGSLNIRIKRKKNSRNAEPRFKKIRLENSE
jgi:hypothetical protein